MRVLLVAGARPNFMKVAPVMSALLAREVDVLLVHTGQHYDDQMSRAFFDDLGIRDPNFHLGVGSGTHAQQTARVLEAMEGVLIETRPDWVVVVGDVNSTLAAALAASKLRSDIGCRIAHVEAGLRSRDWSMPEEVNRVLTDRLSDLLLTPSRDADRNLLAEGIEADRIVFIGNVMVDTLLLQLPRARRISLGSRFGLVDRGYVLTTVHRPSNVDDQAALKTILTGLQAVALECPVVFPMHPRTRERVRQFEFDGLLAGVSLVAPLPYLEMLSLLAGAQTVLTDSGGLQEESTVLGVPCVTLRQSTERPVTVEEGTNRLAPWPLTAAGILAAWRGSSPRRAGVCERCPEGWDGRAAERAADAILGRSAR